MAVAAGTRLGRYEVLELIGAGGMGEVYKARDTRLGRTVALKVLPSHVASLPARRLRFEKEARAVSSLEHPHICVLHDIGTEQGVDFLVLEHLEGQTLAERMVRGKLPRDEALRVAIQTADALEAAHRKGVVHRDLKPGNVMLTKSGVKLLDFGLARLRGDGSGQEETTATQTGPAGQIAGTLPYMSPEQLSGGRVDGRTDVWALGVVLYEMLAGRRPFQGGSAAALTAAILETKPPPLSTAEAPAPPALEHVVQRCLAKDAETRWQSARDVATELSWISSGEVAPSGDSTTPRPRWSRRALLVALLVVAGAAGAWWWRARVAMPALDPQKVVVAAFENQTGEASLDPLGKSTADLIRDGLTAIHGVRVVPGSTPREDRAGPGARREGDGGDDLVQQLAREAGAGLVVSGTYSLAGENLHIQARLTDARSGQFWAFPPALGSRSAPMTAVAAARQRVMGAVAVRVDPTWLGLPDASPPTYDAYQEYRVYIEAGDDPLPHLSRAVELDPDFVLARINLINYLSRSGGYAEAARHVAILEGRKARLTASQRLLVDAVRATLAGRTGEAYLAASEVKRLWPAEPGAIEVYSWFARNAYRFRDAVNALAAPIDWGRLYANSRFRGGLYFLNLTMMLHQLGEHERELLEARRGQHLHPGISSLRDREASALAALGRLDEMERVVTERLALASAGQGGHLLLQVGLELRAHGHRDASAKAMARAQEALQRCSAEEARTQDVREELALLLRVLGRLDEARAIYDRLAREAPADTEKALVWMGDRGVVAALRGERAAALRISDQLARLERPYLFGVHMYERARIAAQLGEKERAVDLLRSAFAQGFTLSSESTWLHVEPSFDALRGHPPFEEVVAPQ